MSDTTQPPAPDGEALWTVERINAYIDTRTVKHTRSQYIRYELGTAMGLMLVGYEQLRVENERLRAQLAASPDLLAACEAALDEMYGLQYVGDDSRPLETIELLEATIAKAKGEQA